MNFVMKQALGGKTTTLSPLLHVRACMCLCSPPRLNDFSALSNVRLTSALESFLHMLQLPHRVQLTVTAWLQHSELWQPKGHFMNQ